MQKTDVNTALAIVVIATAVVLIGGLAIVPTIMQSASANHGERHGFGAGGGEHGGGGGGSSFPPLHSSGSGGSGGGGVSPCG